MKVRGGNHFALGDKRNKRLHRKILKDMKTEVDHAFTETLIQTVVFYCSIVLNWEANIILKMQCLWQLNAEMTKISFHLKLQLNNLPTTFRQPLYKVINKDIVPSVISIQE